MQRGRRGDRSKRRLAFVKIRRATAARSRWQRPRQRHIVHILRRDACDVQAGGHGGFGQAAGFGRAGELGFFNRGCDLRRL